MQPRIHVIVNIEELVHVLSFFELFLCRNGVRLFGPNYLSEEMPVSLGRGGEAARRAVL